METKPKSMSAMGVVKAIGPILETYHKKLGDMVKKKEFIDAFGPVLVEVRRHTGVLDDLSGTIPEIRTQLKASEKKLKAQIAAAKKEAKGTTQSNSSVLLSQIQELRGLVEAIPEPETLDSSALIAEAVEQAVSRATAEITFKEKTPEETRDALEALEDDERLDVTKLKGHETLSKSILDRAIAILDKRTQYLINKVSGGIQSVVGGTNVTIDNTDPKNPVINATAGGSFTVLLPTSGVVNGSNTVFVFASAPNVIVLDNANIMNKQNITPDLTNNWTGTTTITLNQAPNFNIYAF